MVSYVAWSLNECLLLDEHNLLAVYEDYSKKFEELIVPEPHICGEHTPFGLGSYASI